jgi:hypothetical protein
MKLHALMLAFACAFSAAASAAPVLLLCVTENPATVRGRTFQIVFDESSHTVTRDDRKPVKARITDTLVSWTEAIDFGGTEKWTIDRLSGAWRTEIQMGTGVNGKCTAPPPRQF